MKKSTKILICCVAAAAVIFGGIAYVFRPLTFSKAIGGVKTEEIEKLVIHKDGEQVDILSESEIKAIYERISSVKLKAAVQKNLEGCTWIIDVYVKDYDGYISYGCNKDFCKYDGYKKGVGDFLWYIDSSETIEYTLKGHFEKNYGQ